MIAPERLIDAEGRVTLGIFDGPVGEVNHRDYDLRTPFGRPASALSRFFAFNQFQFFGVVSPSLLMGCAIIDTRYISGAFVYFYHPSTGQLVERSLRLPLGMGLSLVQTPQSGTSRFSLGANTFEMSADPALGERTARVSLKSGERAEVTLCEAATGIQPMCICTRAGLRGFVYAQKTAGVKARGSVEWAGGRVDLEADGATGHHDWSAGFMRRETWWNWACLSGRLGDGRLVGLNVSCGVNESSFTESCYWIDGALHKLDAVSFDYDPKDMRRPWRVRSYDGQLDLTFTPEGSHGERVNAVIIASSFEQLFGRFTGRMGAVQVDGVWGYAEEHFARW